MTPLEMQQEGRDWYVPGENPGKRYPHMKNAKNYDLHFANFCIGWNDQRAAELAMDKELRAKPKYFRRKNPTIIFDRAWAEDADEIDEYIHTTYGAKAEWTQIFAFGQVAKRMYYLFKCGFERFEFKEIQVQHDHDNVYTVVVLDEPIVLEAV
jgi:hypothetical protein